MSTPGKTAGQRGRGAWAAAAVTAVAGLLAGCATAATPASPGGQAATAPGGTAATPAASATSVPAVSGRTAVPGAVDCAAWPASAPAVSLPAAFAAVKVDRCVTGAEPVTGRGLWVTATLEQADTGLAALVRALREPSQAYRPGTVCPRLATVPPQVVLVDAAGRAVTPRLPVSGCGLTLSPVLLALGALSWRTLSVRLIAPVAGPASPSASAETVSGSPRGEQTLSAAGAG